MCMLFYQYLTLNVFPTFYLQIIRCMFIPFLILYHVEFMNVGNIKLKWYQKLGTFYASPVVKFCHEVVSNHRNLWTNTTVFYRLQAWCKQYSYNLYNVNGKILHHWCALGHCNKNMELLLFNIFFYNFC